MNTLLIDTGIGAWCLIGLVLVGIAGLAVMIAADNRADRRKRLRVPTVPSRIMPQAGDDLPDWVSEKRRAYPVHLDDTTVDGPSSELNEILKEDGRD